MVNREIIEIDDEKCDGCGVCIPNCAEGALQIVNGKARLISENLCDGIGMCLGHCPKGALKVIVRDADDFDEEAVDARIKAINTEPPNIAQPEKPPVGCGCPSSVMTFLKPAKDRSDQSEGTYPEKGGQPDPATGTTITRSMSTSGDPKPIPSKPPSASTDSTTTITTSSLTPSDSTITTTTSNLMHWPVKLRLVHEQAPFLKDADLLILADCAGVAMHDLHDSLLKDKAVVIFCPKFEDPLFYREKLQSIIYKSGIRSITVAHMEVPCCYGMFHAVQDAVQRSGKAIPVECIIIGRDGDQRKQ